MVETTTTMTVEITIVRNRDTSDLSEKDWADWIKLNLNADDVHIKKLKNFVNNE